ncbi:MAG: hypothetical protein PHQ60_12540 [Sideroxydans sp.]|nr:hypothetical protein [Sideroxydans sp.]
MNQHLTQPEEIDLVLKEMEKDEMTEQRQSSDNRLLSKTVPRNWNTGYVSPYRAAYMRDHNLDL